MCVFTDRPESRVVASHEVDPLLRIKLENDGIFEIHWRGSIFGLPDGGSRNAEVSPDLVNLKRQK